MDFLDIDAPSHSVLSLLLFWGFQVILGFAWLKKKKKEKHTKA